MTGNRNIKNCKHLGRKEWVNVMKFIDLKRQYERLENEINANIKKVLGHESFIMGPEIEELENMLAKYTGRKYAYTCSSGTDALVIPLMAYKLEKTDAVFVPSFTFFASAESVNLAGGTPVFVDIKDDFLINCDDLEHRIQRTLDEGKLVPRGIIAVNLFGQICNFTEIEKIAEKYNLFILEDAAQSMGASRYGKKSGAFGDVSATSFFPAKPLGCYGDGGAIFTDDDELAEKIKSIRVHGQGSGRYDNVRIGLNGRMDTLQAAILQPKLKILDEEVKMRQNVAACYTEQLQSRFVTPQVSEGNISAWAQYTLLADDEGQRDFIVKKMKEKDVPIMVYYPIPLHMQTAYGYLEYKETDVEHALRLSKRVFSVPMHPYLKDDEIVGICDLLKSIAGN